MLALILSLAATAAPLAPVHVTPIQSPAMLQVDLDGDGESEQILVGFSINREITVSIYETDGGMARLNLGRVVDFSGVRDEMLVSLTDAAVTGVPLVHVLVPSAEQCGSWDVDSYVSYHDGTARLALETFNGSDAPAYTEQTVKFHPDRRATLTVVTGDDAGETTTITRRVLTDGVYETVSTVERSQVF